MLITLTGLPRSGTAFMSTLLNMNEFCIAYHELAAYDRNWRNTIANTESQYVADCNTYGYLPQADMNSDRRVYIKSDARQSKASSEMACQKQVDLELLLKLQLIGDDWATGALHIEREDVFTLDGCRRVWEYCFTEPFPEVKIRQLIKLNIQHHEPHIHFGRGVEFVL